MIQRGILEQITIFYNILINNSAFWILMLSSLGLIIVLLLASKFHNKKITKILYTIVYLGVFGTLIYLYHTEILKLFDYLINNIFLFLFFPNLAVYILVIAIVNLIIVRSTFSEKDNKVIKIFNIIFFIIFNIIFYLIIDNVIKNGVNVYEQLSIYTNNDLLVLVELSMKLFIVWLLVLLILKLTRNLISSIELSKSSNKNLLLVEDNNDDELKDAKIVNEVMEINPSYEEIPELNNKYDDLVDVVPVKKRINNPIEQLEIIDDDIVNDYKYEETQNTLTSTIAKVNPFDNLTFDNKIVLTEEETKEENNKITLSSYDSIFKEYNPNLDIAIENDMKVVFDSDNNYLQSILNEIADLKDSSEDEEKIQSIYKNVKMQENKLTLNDYNSLINALLAIKK